jgi:6-phosphogluconolactonase (cycloisomerase 2 family)
LTIKNLAGALLVANLGLGALLWHGVHWPRASQLPAPPEPVAPRPVVRRPPPRPALGEPDSLTWLATERIATGPGTKSVLLDSLGARVYALNLDGLSVCELDRAKRRLLRRLAFAPTPALGFNYARKKAIASFEEKPVEACLVQGHYLWLSLHNGGGVVCWDLQPAPAPPDTAQAHKLAQLTIYRPDSTGRDRAYFTSAVRLPFVATGKTPKVIARTPDHRQLLVANWHSNTVSLLDVARPRHWRKVADIAGLAVPRGLAVSPDGRQLFVGQMGGASIRVIGLDSLRLQGQIRTGVNPRHLVQHGPWLYASLNLGSKLLKINKKEFKVEQQAATLPQPRTIALSPDGALIFVTCYTQNRLQVFRARDLALLGTYRTDAHPVGVAVHQQGDRLEAWVSNYAAGNLNVLSFALHHRAPVPL